MVQAKAFSVGEMIKKGWSKFKQNPVTWIGALIVMTLILGSHPFVSDWITTGDFYESVRNFQRYFTEPELQNNIGYHQPEDYRQVLLSIVYFLVQLGLSLGLLYMGIRAADGRSVHLGHLFSRFQYVFHYLIAGILYGLMILAGIVLLIFPAIVWGMRFGLFPYFIVDKGAGPIHSLKMSSQATFGAKWDLFAFALVTIFLWIGGFLAFLLGLLIMVPLYNIAWGFIYRYLASASEQPEKILPAEVAVEPIPKSQ
jgi:hypothetical protein